jgi:hypothetical protein
MRKGRIVVGLVATTATIALLTALPTVTASGAATSIGFSVPSVVDPIHAAGEPDIGIDPLGRVFVSGPTGTGTQRSVWYGSVDGARTFRAISPGPPPSSITSFVDPPGGGDTDIAFDHRSRQYFTDLYALTCMRVATTADGGATVAQNVYPGGCAGVPGADRPWLAVFDPPGGVSASAYKGPFPLVYQEYNNLTAGGTWTKSTDGLTYAAASGAAHQGADGYPAIDQMTGKVFQAAGVGPASNGTFKLELNIGTPKPDGTLSFLDDPGQPGPVTIANDLPGSPDTLFTVLSIDKGRNLHVAYAVNDPSKPARDQVYESVASAAGGWRTWARPVQVSRAPSLVNVFPWVVAGDAGRADAAWYGSNLAVDPSSQHQQAWNAFLSQVVWPTDAVGQVTGAAPTVSQVKVSPHPVHYNDICLQGSGCVTSQGNRNLADFFKLTVDHSGAAEVVYDDTSNGLAQAGFTPGGNQTIDHAGAPLITVARQSSGPGLYGTDVSGTPSTPVTGLADASGDARYPVIGGTDVPGMDVLGSSLTLSGSTLTVTTKVVDLSHPADTASVVGGPFLQYVTRWQMGNTLYYAAMENTSSNSPTFFAGKAQSVDLCSVSACDPHVLTYPEPGQGGTAEPGRISCPPTPSVSHPCTITVRVDTAAVGSPTSRSLLEEVGAYALASSHPQGALTNAQAEADNVPLEIDGVCCYNFRSG